ncbi:MAG: hypothetical protein NNA31_08615 [Nitrospira sp.]|nr:hypothetical protein [Nitrospira sp.]
MKEQNVRQKGRFLAKMRLVAGLCITICFATIGLSVWFCLFGGSPMAHAQSRSAVIGGLTEQGMVTGVRERTVVIDGRDYEFDQKVEVFDAKGNRVDLSAIVRNAEVRFRLKQDDINKIDRIVVYLPQ